MHVQKKENIRDKKYDTTEEEDEEQEKESGQDRSGGLRTWQGLIMILLFIYFSSQMNWDGLCMSSC